MTDADGCVASLLAQADALIGVKRYLVAAERAKDAPVLAPQDPRPFCEWSCALYGEGPFSVAAQMADEAIRLAPNSASTWVAASLVALGAKNWSAAVTASRQALAIDPDNYAALSNLGVAPRSSGKSREGTEVLARAARVEPDEPAARRNLSRAGLNVARVVILVLLFPIGFLAHIGFVLYLAFAIGSNVLISKNPEMVLRLERWAAPIALFFAKRADDRPPAPTMADRTGDRFSAVPADRSDRPWSAVEGHLLIGTPVVLFGAIAAWSVALVLLIGLVVSSVSWSHRSRGADPGQARGRHGVHRAHGRCRLAHDRGHHQAQAGLTGRCAPYAFHQRGPSAPRRVRAGRFGARRPRRGQRHRPGPVTRSRVMTRHDRWARLGATV